MTGNLLNAFEESINSLFSSGPWVYVVLLPTQGDAEERLVDMTTMKLPIVNLLGGTATINGQYIPEEVIVLRRQNAQMPNQHVLPPPFERDVIAGPICLVRMNEHSIPESFRLKEYHAMRARSLVTRRKVYKRS